MSPVFIVTLLFTTHFFFSSVSPWDKPFSSSVHVRRHCRVSPAILQLTKKLESRTSSEKGKNVKRILSDVVLIHIVMCAPGKAQAQQPRLENRRPSPQGLIGQGWFFRCPYKGG